MTAGTLQDEQRQDVQNPWLLRAMARVEAEQGCPTVGAEFNSAF
jgi:hypothetical protein